MNAKSDHLDLDVEPGDRDNLVQFELARIQELFNYAVLDTDPEPDFDDITKFATQVFETPIALICLLDESRMYFKSKTGIELVEAPRDLSFCEACVRTSQPLVIEDAHADPVFFNNPMVVGPPQIRFYAGAPLITAAGYAIGTLCIIDRTPRKFDSAKGDQLVSLARHVMRLLELRRALLHQRTTESALKASESTLRAFFESSPFMMGIVELHAEEILHVTDNPATVNFFGKDLVKVNDHFAKAITVPLSIKQLYRQSYLQSEVTGKPIHFEYEQKGEAASTWWSATVACMGESTTRKMRYSYVVQNVTDRVLTAKELQEKVRELDIANRMLEGERSHLSQANETLTTLSQTDSLTGLRNRRVFYDALLEDWNSAREQNGPLSLIIMDIDQFKSFNDTFGHLAGDKVLGIIGHTLSHVTRDQDFCARLGGEEFAILLPGTTIEDAALIAERFRLAIENQSWDIRPITASFGISSYREDMESERDMLRLADRALYHSKRNGRNRVSIYGDDGEIILI